MGTEVRLHCDNCLFGETLGEWEPGRKLHFRAAYHFYSRCQAVLWYRTTVGSHCLWALDEVHLEYMAAYVASKQRSAHFPSIPGDRQIADKFPSWMVRAKNRQKVLRGLQRLRELG